MHIAVQVANPHAHFYAGVNKDDNQMNEKPCDKVLTIQIPQLCIKNKEDEQLHSH